MNTEAILQALQGMKRSRIRNYIAPGLTSWIIGGKTHGKVRLFTSDRDTLELITPHSHRFDFTCLVLWGRVIQVLFTRTGRRDQGNAYAVGVLRAPTGGIGEYQFIPGEAPDYFSVNEYEYTAGETYGMRRTEIHTIRFSKGAAVLFFEAPESADESLVLEPWSDDRRVPTFVTQPWMFDRSVETQETGGK